MTGLLDEAWSRSRPKIFNTDQGVQSTSGAWIGKVEGHGIKVSMNGRERCVDEYFRGADMENGEMQIYLSRNYDKGDELKKGLGAYFEFYNKKRSHSNLGKISRRGP